MLMIWAQLIDIAYSSTNVWLKRIASMVVFRREIEVGPIGHRVGLRGGVGSTFLKSSESVQLY
jgi:hypothetical protein